MNSSWNELPPDIRRRLRECGVCGALYIPKRDRFTDVMFVDAMVAGYSLGKRKTAILREIEFQSGWVFDYCRQVERRLRARIDVERSRYARLDVESLR